MNLDLDNLMQKYHNVSREEVEKILETTRYPDFCEVIFEKTVEYLHQKREDEKMNGRKSVIAGPLVQVLYVHVLSDKIDQNEPLTIYGRIYVEFCDTTSGNKIVRELYSRENDAAEVLGPSGTLTLISPDSLCKPSYSFMPLHNTKLVVDVCVGRTKLFAQQFLCVEDTTDTEQVKVEYVHGEPGCSLALCYVAMPFAVYGHVDVRFFKLDEEENHRSLNVYGKIGARYGNTYGSYASEECTLFEKQSYEFERVEIDLIRSVGSIKLSRGCVGLPAYSSLIVDLNLSEFGTNRKLLEEIVEFPAEANTTSGRDFIVDDILINVRVMWWSPRPQGRCNEEECDTELEDESSNDEMSLIGISKEESDDEQMMESCVPEVSSNLRLPWVLHAHQSRPPCSPAVEIFSVFIGRENFKSLEIYGSVEVLSDKRSFYIFKREAKDPYGLPEHSKTIPVLDGARVYEEWGSLEIKFDLKDVKSHFQIRGYADWDLNFDESWLDKQLCSVVGGQHGFAAICYTIFSEAVQANVEVLCNSKIFGSLVAQYNNYDYTSRYNKDYYRIVLFQRSEEDPAEPGPGGVIPLSRSKVVVPLNSSIIIEANLWDGVSDQVLSSCSKEFTIGTACHGSITFEGNECSLLVYVKWDEVSG